MQAAPPPAPRATAPPPAPKAAAPPPAPKVTAPPPAPAAPPPPVEESWDQSYDQGGYDQGGYDQGGHDQGGYDQSYDQGGHDQGGYDQGHAGYASQCRALYSYAGENETDLIFNEGDVINVVNDADPSGWWEGELNGSVGYFPSNFVEKI